MHPFRLCAFADEASSDVADQIAALTENGYSLLEARGIGAKNIVDLSLSEARALKEQLSAHGIQVWSIGSPIGKVKITDDFMPHLDKFKHVLELAEILGASCIRLFSFYIEKDADPAEYRDEVLERLSAFCEASKGSRVTLCHENEKGIYGDTAERCLDLHRALPRLRCVFDPANFLQCGVGTLKAWSDLSRYVHYLHIKDVNKAGMLVPAGQGEGCIPELIRLYRGLGGSVLTLEPHLATFQGLDALENGEKSAINAFTYASGREAFDAAANALKQILEKEPA